MKKENKITFILYLIASICFFVSAILGFIDKNNMAIANLGLGACFLSLSSVYYQKYKKDKEKENIEKKCNQKIC